MTARRGRGTPARGRRKARLKSAMIGGGVLPALLAMFWSAVWPHVTAALLLGGIGAVHTTTVPTSSGASQTAAT